MSETSSGLTAAARASTASRSVPAGRRTRPRCRRPSSIGTRTMCSQRRQPIAVQFGGLVGAEELAGGDQQGRAGAGQDVGGLAGGVAGVQRHQHAARVMGRQARHHPVPGVRRPDRDPVPGVDAELDHRRGGLADLGPQFAERDLPIVGDQRIVVGELVGNPVQDLRNGPWIVPCPSAWPHVIDAPLTKQVLGRLAYKGDRGPGVPGRGPRSGSPTTSSANSPRSRGSAGRVARTRRSRNGWRGTGISPRQG